MHKTFALTCFLFKTLLASKCLHLCYTVFHINNEAKNNGIKVPDYGIYEDEDWWALAHFLDYLVLSNSAIANCRSISAFSPNGSNTAIASAASFLANCWDFSIPITAG